MPSSAKARASSSDISTSMNGSRRSARSTRVTSTPSAAKTEAYSQPTGPPPMTTAVPGIRPSDRMLSLSCTSGSSNGTSGGWNGLEPVAIRTTSACRMRSPPSSVPTTTVRPGASRADPRISSMPCRSRLAATEAVLVAMTSEVRAASRSSATVGSSWWLSP
jgi:hypothetical protein